LPLLVEEEPPVEEAMTVLPPHAAPARTSSERKMEVLISRTPNGLKGRRI
jgi:hypothetical protein